MTARARCLALLLAAAAAPPVAAAQRARAVVDVGAGSVGAPGVARPPLYADAAAALDWSRASVAARLSSAPSARLPGGTYGALSLAGVQPLGGGWFAALGLTAGTGERASWFEAARRDVELAPTLARGPWTLGARFVSTRVHDWDARDARARELLLRRDFARGWVAVTAGLASFADTTTVQRDTTYLVAGFPFRGAVERLATTARDYDRAALEVGGAVRDVVWVARGGMPVSRDPHAPYAPWASLTTTWPIGPRTAIVLAAGRHPGLPEHRIAASRFASAGVRLTNLARPAAALVDGRARDGLAGEAGARLQVVAGSGGRRLVVITGLRAQRLDLNGDMTDWEPVTLERVGPDVWQCVLALAPGAHRVVISVDGGEWRPPPGLPIDADGFGGDVGVLLVPDAPGG